MICKNDPALCELLPPNGNKWKSPCQGGFSDSEACHSVGSEGSSPDVTPGVWHHVGFALSGGVTTLGSATLYVDGMLPLCVFVLRSL